MARIDFNAVVERRRQERIVNIQRQMGEDGLSSRGEGVFNGDICTQEQQGKQRGGSNVQQLKIKGTETDHRALQHGPTHFDRTTKKQRVSLHVEQEKPTSDDDRVADYHTHHKPTHNEPSKKRKRTSESEDIRRSAGNQEKALTRRAQGSDLNQALESGSAKAMSENTFEQVDIMSTESDQGGHGQEDLFIPMSQGVDKQTGTLATAETEQTSQAERFQSPSIESTLPKWAPAKKIGKRKKTEWSTQQIVDTSKGKQISRTIDWYASIGPKAKVSRSDVVNLQHLRDLIRAHKANRDGGDVLSNSKIREKIHQIEFYNFLRTESGANIKKSRILDDGGLPDIFNAAPGMFPKDIVADTIALYARLVVGDFDPDLMRGITIQKGKLSNGLNRTTYKLKLPSEYCHRRSANVAGNNGLQNGAWWPNRATAVRDGAHGEQEAGIAGQAGKGVFAICLSEGGYLDEDNGEQIKYCGTESATEEPTRSTKLMLESATMTEPQPVRVLRGVNKGSMYAPSVGVRFDGLYDICGYELVNPKTAMYRFSLKRREGQDPIRFGDGETSRPTPQEKKALLEIKDIIGMKVA